MSSNFDAYGSPQENKGEDLPTYQDPGQSSWSGRDNHDGSANGSNGGGSSSSDPRAEYALQLQSACKTALKRLKQNNMLANSNWAEPLTAAPTAISVMAFLLKTAADKKAAGLTVASVEVKDETGNVVGKLPSRYFHTNLQHCSDLGRLAFLDAQKRMSTMNSVAQTMMQDSGSISYIVELLEDPEDAKYNLKPEMEEVRGKATECRKNCEAIKQKFEYWQLVILHLGQTALDLRGEKIQLQKQVEESKGAAQVDAERYNTQAATASSEIQRMKEQLDRAIGRVSRAQDELDIILSLPPIEEPSHFEDIREAQGIAPITNAPKIQRGWVSDTGAKLFGISTSQRREDEAHAEAHRAKQERRQNQIIGEEKARRASERARAEQRLKEAREKEAQLQNEIEKAVRDLSLSENRLVNAKANLAKASSDLERLGNQELELKELVEILRTSTSELGNLKKQLEPLVLFFSKLEDNISHEVMSQVDTFLNLIERNTRPGSEADEVTAIRLRGASKKKVLEAALQIQGGFSAMSDISAAYVQISNSCIREAINRMEYLSSVRDEDWDREREKFKQWCQGAIDDIDGISRATTDNMDAKMMNRIGMLRTRAIKAVADGES